jgi:aldehyde:ferredoxin oxidoreductase
MKFLRVNMTTKALTIEEVPLQYQGLGGRGLTSIMINAEVPPTCDPLGPENKLIFAPGLLTGTHLVNSSRISIGAKSPLTGGIKESNVGGTFPASLGRLGITAIIVEGKAPEGELYLLRLDQEGEPVLVRAQEYKGMRTYALAEKLFNRYGEKNGILCIGPAGEYQLRSASIQSTDVDGRPCRAAGRGGLGAVMGAKGLKAVVIDSGGKKSDPISDKETFQEASKAFVQILKSHPYSSQLLPALGTAAMVAPMNQLGAFPSYNATRGFFEGWEKISGENMAKTIGERGGKNTHMGCSQCIIHCSNEYVDKQGKYMTSSLEYETIYATGGMCGIDDLDIIARLDFLCDDIGLDTINTGVAIAVAMDAGYRKFGDGQAAIDLLEEVAKASEIGKIIGNGPVAVGKHFNHHRVPVVKNQALAAFDPRGIQGMGVTYCTSPMGADHTAGTVIAHNLAAWGGTLDPLKAEGQVQASRQEQIAMAASDCLGVCLFALAPVGFVPDGLNILLKIISSRLGTPFTFNDVAMLGLKVLGAELEFNRKAGFTVNDDRLPRFYYEEPLPPHNKTFIITDKEIDSTLNF